MPSITLNAHHHLSSMVNPRGHDASFWFRNTFLSSKSKKQRSHYSFWNNENHDVVSIFALFGWAKKITTSKRVNEADNGSCTLIQQTYPWFTVRLILSLNSSTNSMCYHNNNLICINNCDPMSNQQSNQSWHNT